jgi:glucose 1-dehydrogenase
MRLKDKVAIVTGANSGIGRAIAERFATEGAHVAVNYRANAGHEQEVVEMLASLPTPGMGAPGDASKRGDVEQLVAQVVRKFGRLDIAVANAGIEIKKPFLEVTDDEWNKVLSVNLYGAFVLSQVAARQMVKQGAGGKLIFMSSVHEDIPFPQYASYCASKGGIRMLMRGLAMELAGHKINCNNIAPGAIATPINRKVLQDPEQLKNAISEIPWGRFGKPEEVPST